MTVTTHRDARTRRTILSTLDRLVQEQRIGRFAYFFLSGEGVFYPDGTEESSGHVIDESGRTYAFWTVTRWLTPFTTVVSTRMPVAVS